MLRVARCSDNPDRGVCCYGTEQFPALNETFRDASRSTRAPFACRRACHSNANRDYSTWSLLSIGLRSHLRSRRERARDSSRVVNIGVSGCETRSHEGTSAGPDCASLGARFPLARPDVKFKCSPAFTNSRSRFSREARGQLLLLGVFEICPSVIPHSR